VKDKPDDHSLGRRGEERVGCRVGSVGIVNVEYWKLGSWDWRLEVGISCGCEESKGPFLSLKLKKVCAMQKVAPYSTSYPQSTPTARMTDFPFTRYATYDMRRN
jgi:hypothetical protein